MPENITLVHEFIVIFMKQVKIKVNQKFLIYFSVGLTILIVLIFGVQKFFITRLTLRNTQLELKLLEEKNINLNKEIQNLQNELNNIKNQNQYLVNQELKKEIENIQTTFGQAVKDYEKILDLGKTTDKISSLFAQALNLLSKKEYASASLVLADLEKEIQKEQTKMTASFRIPQNIIQSNTPPSSGYQRQKVVVSGNEFMVSIVSADLNTTRVIVDTASEKDCYNDCPVLPLSEYVARNNAFAGINGSYFCPASYPQCADKKNSFDTLLMNKNKYYFNSDNNVYSTVPAVIFMGNSARFVRHSSEWGRDTSVDAVIANQPLLTLGNQIVFEGDNDPKHNVKGNRSFVGVTGNTVYIGVVHNAAVKESAQVVNALGIANCLNLDDGGSTALWYGSYKVGPGRNIPNALLLVKK